MDFSSFAGLARHLAAVEVATKVNTQHALEQVAKLVECTAKDEIGHYQPEIGPYPAWAPLADSTEATKAAKGYPAGAPLLASGAMRDGISHYVQGSEAVIGSPDVEALYHEFGTSKMPPRPVFGPALIQSEKMIKQTIGAAVMTAVIGSKGIAPAGLHTPGEHA